MKNRVKKITMIGTGYVGLVSGVCFAKQGFSVKCVDIIPEKIEAINSAQPPIYEKGLDELLKEMVSTGMLKGTTHTEEAILNSDVAFICVGTPSKESGEMDTVWIESAARDIGRALKKKDEYFVVTAKSTIVPGTTDSVIMPLLEEESGKVAGKDFGVAFCPEFLREGNAIEDFLKPDRVVIGAIDDRSYETVHELFDWVPKETPILKTDLRTAEMIKYGANSFLATKISFINTISNMCEALGVNDIYEVAEGIGLDFRISPYFLRAGAGFGGSCFSGDTTIFVTNSQEIVAKPIEQLFEDDKNMDINTEVEVITPNQGTQVFAFDQSTKKSKMADVHCFTRRWYKGLMIELTTRMGRKLRITADHPIILYDLELEGINVKLASEVKPGDWLIAVTSLPLLKQIRTIDLLHALSGTELENFIKIRPHDDSLIHLYPEYIKHVPKSIFKHKYDIKRKNYMPLLLYRYLKTQGHLNIDSKKLRLFTTKGKPTYCPAVLEVDEDFMRLLGYYIAEGWITIDLGRKDIPRERIGFAFGTHEQEYIDDLHRILDLYEIRYFVNTVENTHKTIISSKPLAFLLRDVLKCGTRSENKSIPKLAFHVNPKLKLAFLQGAWSGDGAITPLHYKRNFMYEYGTVSKDLAEGMSLLLQSLGIIPSIRYRRMKKSTQLAYVLRISGIQQLEDLKGIFGSQKQKTIEKLIRGYEKRIKPCGYMRKDGFVILEVTNVNTSKTADYVYSMETSTGTLLTASGLVSHNCFPKDVKAIIAAAKKANYDPLLLNSVIEVNKRQPLRLISMTKEVVGEDLSGKQFAILGLAFKPDTDDIREAPAITVIDELLKNNAIIKAYDPEAMDNMKQIFGEKVQFTESKEVALRDTDVCIIVTNWKEFTELQPNDVKTLMKTPIVIDGRKTVDADTFLNAGVTYRRIGLKK